MLPPLPSLSCFPSPSILESIHPASHFLAHCTDKCSVYGSSYAPFTVINNPLECVHYSVCICLSEYNSSQCVWSRRKKQQQTLLFQMGSKIWDKLQGEEKVKAGQHISLRVSNVCSGPHHQKKTPLTHTRAQSKGWNRLSCQLQCILILMSGGVNVSSSIQSNLFTVWSLLHSQTERDTRTNTPACPSYLNSSTLQTHSPPSATLFFPSSHLTLDCSTQVFYWTHKRARSWVDGLYTHCASWGKQREGTEGLWVNNTKMLWLAFILSLNSVDAVWLLGVWCIHHFYLYLFSYLSA